MLRSTDRAAPPCRATRRMIYIISYPSHMLSISYIYITYPDHISISYIHVIYPPHISSSQIHNIHTYHLSILYSQLICPYHISILYIIHIMYPTHISISYVHIMYTCQHHNLRYRKTGAPATTTTVCIHTYMLLGCFAGVCICVFAFLMLRAHLTVKIQYLRPPKDLLLEADKCSSKEEPLTNKKQL